MKVTIQRQAHLIQTATLGILSVDDKPFCYTLERPWLGNKPSVSSIPVGSYQCVMSVYHKHNYPAYEVTNVPNRTRILIHIGNSVDDVEGCIIVGMRQQFNPAPAVLQSRTAFYAFMQALNQQPFTLELVN